MARGNWGKLTVLNNKPSFILRAVTLVSIELGHILAISISGQIPRLRRNADGEIFNDDYVITLHRKHPLNNKLLNYSES